MRTRLVIAGLMIVLSGLACLWTDATPEVMADLSGTYDVTGTTLEGADYSGVATITRSGGDSYDMVWEIGTQTQTGSGRFNGSTFNVNWQMDSTASGTATYTLQADGSLVGTWTMDGASDEGTETLTPK